MSFDCSSRERLQLLNAGGARIRVSAVRALVEKADAIMRQIFGVLEEEMPKLDPLDYRCFRVLSVYLEEVGQVVLNVYINPPGDDLSHVTQVFVFRSAVA